MKQPLVIITGPTAVGKTALSVQLAKDLNGEVISADSMQVYRFMDIGSAKVTEGEKMGVPHHLIDVLDPWEAFNVARFQVMAKQAMEGIYGRGHLPVAVGGTGFYLQALIYDVDFKENNSGAAVRQELEELGESKGNGYLHQMLQGLDPEAASQIHANNRKRIIRAIEYFRLTGQPISEHNRQEREKTSPYRFYYYVLDCPRAQLYGRIDRRVDRMVEAGLVKEVQKLKEMGCHRGMASMQGLGYKEVLDYLEGKHSQEEAIRILKRDTRHFAKRQLTWFRRERDVRWIELEDFGYDMEKVRGHILEDFRRGEEAAQRVSAGAYKEKTGG